ncbi:hypothetical protein T4C_3166 [Trichinella pseudospiralis]|uniref:Uncharacterized protein n=1 Tax=Trichinella pseudospiralis TaxID=6337 RepID=A0A0V1JRJ0_TRIPS|nr:hypothetical protein T4C_3166 [Trichinella pseudospiralis]
MLNSGAVIGGMMAKMQCMLKMKRKRLITKRKKQDKSNMFIEMNNHRQEADKTGVNELQIHHGISNEMKRSVKEENENLILSCST